MESKLDQRPWPQLACAHSVHVVLFATSTSEYRYLVQYLVGWSILIVADILAVRAS